MDPDRTNDGPTPTPMAWELPETEAGRQAQARVVREAANSETAVRGASVVGALGGNVPIGSGALVGRGGALAMEQTDREEALAARRPLELAFNSFKLAIATAFFSVAIGVSAAHALSRLRFRGRTFLMLAILAVLMLPAVAALAPLYVQLNSVRVGDFVLRNSIPGVALAVISGALPFAIWNLKGYLDTIPRELEEAAAVDGATRNQIFLRVILPLATPALAVTAFLGFIAGWTEFYFSWMFLTEAKDFTLSMALNAMVGQFATTTPWSDFAAFAVLFALPVSAVYLVFQKYIVGGLAVGGVKG